MNTTARLIQEQGLDPLKGPKCPYCGSHSHLVPASVVYKGKLTNPDGKLWVCSNYPECDSYVGAHREPPLKDYPLGTLADLQLRTARKAVHNMFDLLHKYRHMSRKDAYKWLQEQLNMKEEDCHIAEMDIVKCNLVYVVTLKYFHNTYDELNNQSKSANLSWL